MADASEALALYRAARAEGLQARDVVPAARTVLFSGCSDPGRLVTELARLTLERPAASEGPAVEVESVCVHGDTPGAVGHAYAVRAALEAAGFVLQPW